MCVDLCMYGVMCDVILACGIPVCCVHMCVEAQLSKDFSLNLKLMNLARSAGQ